ncbi:MAG: hypothetical protein N2422_02360 [Rhodobacteraceae bacterium]|nr:hypothetical protein [Paracoccaceae bacterium]
MSDEDRKPYGDALPDLVETFRLLADDLRQEASAAFAAVRREGRFDDAAARRAVRDVRSILIGLLKEEARSARRGKEDRGGAGGVGLDLDRARAEIRERLDRIRDAASGG